MFKEIHLQCSTEIYNKKHFKEELRTLKVKHNLNLCHFRVLLFDMEEIKQPIKLYPLTIQGYVISSKDLREMTWQFTQH